MAIGNYPVWPFDPNWSSSVNETLEWATDILTSPTGSEQRRTVRYYPRRTVDFSIMVDGEEQRFLDNLLFSYSTSDWYLPAWFDVTVSTAVSVGALVPCTPTTGIVAGSIVFIRGSTAFDYAVAEVASVSVSGITLTAPPSATVAEGSRISPMSVARLVEQPSVSALTDGLVSAEPQFMITQQPDAFEPSDADAGLTLSYRDFWVLMAQPDWVDQIERGQQRMVSTLDSRSGIPVQVDSAQRPFPVQKQSYIINGMAEHTWFYSLLQWLKGRTSALWVPTWMDDMRIVESTTVTGLTISVGRCGYTLAGGPRPERQDIMIETLDGRCFFRRITNSVVAGQTETLLIDSAIGAVIAPSGILRVCFMSIMRLDHDAIEIEHVTDLAGISKSQLMFRAAPDTRVPTAGF